MLSVSECTVQCAASIGATVVYPVTYNAQDAVIYHATVVIDNNVNINKWLILQIDLCGFSNISTSDCSQFLTRDL